MKEAKINPYDIKMSDEYGLDKLLKKGKIQVMKVARSMYERDFITFIPNGEYYEGGYDNYHIQCVASINLSGKFQCVDALHPQIIGFNGDCSIVNPTIEQYIEMGKMLKNKGILFNKKRNAIHKIRRY